MFIHYLIKCKKIRPLVTIKIRSLWFRVIYRCGLLPNVHCDGRISVVQSLSLQGRGKIVLGDGCSLGVYPSPNLYHGECYIEARNPEAEVVIGERVFINNNATIIADKSSIQIGDDTLIGPNFMCFDSNFHPLDPNKRLSSDYQSNPVKIGKNVFIGANVMILKGTIIGDDSIIGAGCVVSGIISDGVIVTRSKELKVFDIYE